MQQLIMRWKNDGKPSEGFTLPDDTELKCFTDIPNAEEAWLDIVSYMYEGEDIDVYKEKDFYKRLMTDYPGYSEDRCFFLSVGGELAATIAVICDYTEMEGYVHMVSCKPQFRGRGLGTLMNKIVVDIFKTEGMFTAHLTTDDWRIPAIKSYLRAGFVPELEGEPDFVDRWEKIIGAIEKDEKPLLISYSYLEDMPFAGNTAESCRAFCQTGFDAIKGDVAVTKDKKLIMCHDSYFVFDSDGRAYPQETEAENKVSISDLSFDECLKIEYRQPSAYEHSGYYAKACDLETFIKICKENGKIAYITLRDKEIKEITEQTYSLLKKYGMTERCIINSFSFRTLYAMRMLDSKICLSQVFPFDTAITVKDVDRMAILGNGMLCLSEWETSASQGGVLEASRKAIVYAKAKDLKVYTAWLFNKEGLLKGSKYGISGYQCMNCECI